MLNDSSERSGPLRSANRKRIRAGLLAVLTIGLLPGMIGQSVAQDTAKKPATKPNTTQRANQARKPNPAFAKVEDVAGLPRVLLIGDSISIGYTVPTRKYLKGIANVHRIPENGGPTSKGLESFDRWLGDQQWDLIHFNWGLHDLKYMNDDTPETGQQQVSPADYEKNMRELMTRLKERGKIVIFATTTPYPEGVKPIRIPADAAKYNKIATQLAKEHGIQVNDLYAFALPQLDKIQREKNVHFLPEGSDVLGKHVAEVIKQALEQP